MNLEQILNETNLLRKKFLTSKDEDCDYYFKQFILDEMIDHLLYDSVKLHIKTKDAKEKITKLLKPSSIDSSPTRKNQNYGVNCINVGVRMLDEPAQKKLRDYMLSTKETMPLLKKSSKEFVEVETEQLRKYYLEEYDATNITKMLEKIFLYDQDGKNKIKKIFMKPYKDILENQEILNDQIKIEKQKKEKNIFEFSIDYTLTGQLILVKGLANYMYLYNTIKKNANFFKQRGWNIEETNKRLDSLRNLVHEDYREFITKLNSLDPIINATVTPKTFEKLYGSPQDLFLFEEYKSQRSDLLFKDGKMYKYPVIRTALTEAFSPPFVNKHNFLFQTELSKNITETIDFLNKTNFFSLVSKEDIGSYAAFIKELNIFLQTDFKSQTQEQLSDLTFEKYQMLQNQIESCNDEIYVNVKLTDSLESFISDTKDCLTIGKTKQKQGISMINNNSTKFLEIRRKHYNLNSSKTHRQIVYEETLGRIILQEGKIDDYKTLYVAGLSPTQNIIQITGWQNILIESVKKYVAQNKEKYDGVLFDINPRGEKINSILSQLFAGEISLFLQIPNDSYERGTKKIKNITADTFSLKKYKTYKFKPTKETSQSTFFFEGALKNEHDYQSHPPSEITDSCIVSGIMLDAKKFSEYRIFRINGGYCFFKDDVSEEMQNNKELTIADYTLKIITDMTKVRPIQDIISRKGEENTQHKNEQLYVPVSVIQKVMK